jgi:hypothetical protein
MDRNILTASKRFHLKKGGNVRVNIMIGSDDASLAVCVVLFGKISGIYRGVPVKLIGRCTCRTAYTGRDGFAIFSSLKPGFYRIAIPRLRYRRNVYLYPGDNYRCIMPLVCN